MDSNANHRIAQLSSTPTVPRQTPNNDFGAVMGRALVGAARMGSGVLSSLGGGGPVLSAAVSTLASTVSAVAPVGGLAPTSPLGSGKIPSSSPLDTTPLTGKGEQWDLLEAQRLMSSQSQSFNLAYMQLQDSMQKESREFTTLTNIMKVRHDSAKAAINNIR